MWTDVASAPNPGAAFANALLDELERGGVRELCLSPGYRSAPLALAATRTSLRRRILLDERSAAFFALGLAKASRRPVALLCTSGSAVAHWMPAVVEAHHGRVPLILLSADRPPELQDWGAPQTIDQTRIFGSHVRWFAEAPVSGEAANPLRYARALGARAVGEALGSPPGPVHLNLPFREPLEPLAVAGSESVVDDAARSATKPYTQVRSTPAPLHPEDAARLFEWIASAEQGIVACGPMDASTDLPEAVSRLARAAGWPLFAEPTSQVRFGLHVDAAPIVCHTDLILRDPEFSTAQCPQALLHFGAPLTSKAYRHWLEAGPPADVIVVDPEGGWRDPSHLASELLRADPVSFCHALAARLEARCPERARSAWARRFARADETARAVIEQEVDANPALLEANAVRELAAALPEEATWVVANSMPVRDLDAFVPASTRRLRVVCNRGANGIDGTLSTAFGVCAASAGPVVLLTGDLAFLHDVAALGLAAQSELSLAVVVLNNDGGGIFSFLPMAEAGEPDFEELFRTPQEADLGAIVRGFGAQHQRVEDPAELRSALKEALGTKGVQVVEVPVDPGANVAHQRHVQQTIAARLSEIPS